MFTVYLSVREFEIHHSIKTLLCLILEIHHFLVWAISVYKLAEHLSHLFPCKCFCSCCILNVIYVPPQTCYHYCSHDK
ncbi:hypothetical protein PRUPE_5G154200 [Prunus persica]|uniref:Uncharacterized protein n=1 Tax=Prunus persica TaxID=3760 RepID=M5W9Z3_PRUPE|nr:hypothetical protein PRUPE_5G154200 [Prunus persica]